MNWDQLHTIVLETTRRHWLTFFLFLFTISLVCVSIVVRHMLRRRWRALLEQNDEPIEFEQRNALSEKDQEAFALIRGVRRRIWDLPESRLTLSTDFLIPSTLDLVRKVAAIYHPDNAAPEFEASLAQSVLLAQRVVNRLHRLTRFTPFRLLSSRKLSEYQRFYRLYQQIDSNPLVKALKRHRRLYKVAGWLVSARHLANPFYWAGKDLSREGYFYLLRWFHATYLAQVGREAMRLYSGRPFGSQEEEEASQAGCRLFQVCAQWGGPGAEEWALLVEVVGKAPQLDAQNKLALLTRCAAKRQKTEDSGDFAIHSRRVEKWYLQALSRLGKTEPIQFPGKQEAIEAEVLHLSMHDQKRL
jgi:hypothetical protein